MAENDEKLTGIDGWLLVFLAMCVGVSLFYLIAFGYALLWEESFTQRTGETFPIWLLVLARVYSAARIGLPLVILWRMIVRRRWDTIRLAVALIWVLFLGVPLFDFVSAWLTSGLPPIIGSFVRGAFWGVVLAWLGTAYLLRSTRVANTYPRLAHLDEIFD